MVCDIGWRKDARRVIIFTTDESFHIALDGKLGGLVEPNDGLCHLDNNGYYTYSTVQDYPSIGHINHLAKQKSFSIIWAVTEKQINLYSTLTKLVQGSSAGKISYDSSNIVDLIRRQYQAITTSIEIQTTYNGSACETKITPVNCGDGAIENNQCKDVTLGTAVQFEIEVKLKECLFETIYVSPVGLSRIRKLRKA